MGPDASSSEVPSSSSMTAAARRTRTRREQRPLQSSTFRGWTKKATTAAAASAIAAALPGAAASAATTTMRSRPSSSWSYSFAAGNDGQLTSQPCSEAVTALLRHSFTLLPLVVESCSHPSGLNSLLLQPYSYAGGGLGNVDECPLLSCLALQPGRDGMPPYAGVCVPSECQASDLTSSDFVATLQRNNLAAAGTTQQPGAVAASASKHSVSQTRVAELQQQQLQQQQQQSDLADEYASVFERIQEINGFLPSGWTCGEWRYPAPANSGTTTWAAWCAFVAMVGALLFGSVVGTCRGWRARRDRRRRRGPKARPRRGWASSCGSTLEMERLLEPRPVAHGQPSARPTKLAVSVTHDSEDDDDDDERDDSSTVPNTPQTITPLSSGSTAGADDDRRPLLSPFPFHSPTDDGTCRTPRATISANTVDSTSSSCKDDDVAAQRDDVGASSTSSLSAWDDFDLYKIHLRLVKEEGRNQLSVTPTTAARDTPADERGNCVDQSSTRPPSSSLEEDGTGCLHGVRVLSLLWIVLGHTAAITSSTGPGYSNPGDVLPPRGWANTLPGQLVFASRYAVDTFLVLSGFLLVTTASRMSHALSARKWTWPFLMVISRIARILPTYLTCLGIFVFVAPRYLGSGVFWYQWQSLLQPCAEYGWTNLLFVNNFYPTDTSTTSTCFYHSWYLAVDVQVFVLGVLLLAVYRRSCGAGLVATASLFVALTVMQALLTHGRGWSLNTFDGAAVARYDVEAYAKPHVRAPSYLAGMVCAMLLLRRKQREQPREAESLDSGPIRRIRRNGGTTVLVLACCAAMGFVTFCTASGAYARRPCQYGEWPHEAGCGSLWSPRVTFLYTAFSRTLWVLAVSTLLFLLCGTDSSSYGDEATEPPLVLQVVRSLLSLSLWRLPSKLSFAAYLMHPVWLLVWQLGAPSSKYAWRTATFVMQYAAVCAVTFVSSYVIAALVEAPCARLWRRMMTGPPHRRRRPAAAHSAPPRRFGDASDDRSAWRGGRPLGPAGSTRRCEGDTMLATAASMAAPKYGSVNGV